MYLYLLKFKDGKRFKIGITDDLQARLIGLGRENFDLKSSLAFEAPPQVIKPLEKTLHADFDPFRQNGAELKTGHTEVFSIDCWDIVIDEIEAKRKKFKHLNIEVRQVQKAENKPSKAIRPEKFNQVAKKKQKLYTKTHRVRDFIETIKSSAEKITIAHTPDGHFIGFAVQVKAGSDFPNPPTIEGRHFGGMLFGQYHGRENIWYFGTKYFDDQRDVQNTRAKRYYQKVINYILGEVQKIHTVQISKSPHVGMFEEVYATMDSFKHSLI